ncbi:MAG: NUDIX domain-containing protein [Candidatus Sungiibacteriota bacterium]
MNVAVIDKLAWIHIRDKKILMTRSRGKDTWYIGGGKREQGESDSEALIREVKEELTVDLMPHTIKHMDTFEAQAHGKPAGTIVRMTCYTGDYVGVVRPAAEIEEIAWFAYGDKGKTAPVDKIIFDWLKKQNLIS